METEERPRTEGAEGMPGAGSPGGALRAERCEATVTGPRGPGAQGSLCVGIHPSLCLGHRRQQLQSPRCEDLGCWSLRLGVVSSPCV